MRSKVYLLPAFLLVVVVAACATAPYTGRSQLILLSEPQEMQLGADAYKQTLAKAKLVHDPETVALVRSVGERIAAVADKRDYRWEFNVIDDDKQVNAFALPGGKVAVYTGLFKVARDTAGLAAVMGHEVAHALAHHGAERMSQGMAVQVVATGASIALGSQSPAAQQGIMQALGLGAQVGVILPFGRQQESEADHIGLILMAKAGYDPNAAYDLWRRMEQASSGGPPEFLSTHPSYGTRQETIKGWIPEAMRYYRLDTAAQVVRLPGR